MAERSPEQAKANNMADQILDARRVARDQQRRLTAATAIGLNALKPVIHFQASLLRLWAKNIERLADNVEKTATSAGSSRIRTRPPDATFRIQV